MPGSIRSSNHHSPLDARSRSANVRSPLAVPLWATRGKGIDGNIGAFRARGQYPNVHSVFRQNCCRNVNVSHNLYRPAQQIISPIIPANIRTYARSGDRCSVGHCISYLIRPYISRNVRMAVICTVNIAWVKGNRCTRGKGLGGFAKQNIYVAVPGGRFAAAGLGSGLAAALLEIAETVFQTLDVFFR